MAKFEKIEYIDGGPNDKPTVIGYIIASSLKEANEILNVNHGFIQVREISDAEYSKRKLEAKRAFNLFK